LTALVLCRFVHFLAAMLTFGVSGYFLAYAPERLKLALSPAGRRLALIASVVALMAAIMWLALESASMAAVAPDLIGAVLTDTARPQPERQAQPLGARQNANVGFRQVATIAAFVAIEIQRRSDKG
jgi:hypothetical protein